MSDYLNQLDYICRCGFKTTKRDDFDKHVKEKHKIVREYDKSENGKLKEFGLGEAPIIISKPIKKKDKSDQCKLPFGVRS